MGALHAGHEALIRLACEHASRVAVTIFVNPTQFGPGEDLERYPRDLDADLQRSEAAGAALVFAPAAAEMYPPGESTRVVVKGLTGALCGASRPGHFEGVATVVAKLFAVAGPCAAVFGRKDYQQLKVVERLARDLLMPVEIVSCPTVRDSDGLALSSRNRYLDAGERQRALALPRGLSAAARCFDEGERSVERLQQQVIDELLRADVRKDYVHLVDADSLVPFSRGSRIGERALLAVAAMIGSTRLIDNVVLGEEPAPLGQGGYLER
jgi:pantoate--beta-alanine ligase